MVLGKYVDDFFGSQQRSSRLPCGQILRTMLTAIGLGGDPNKSDGFMMTMVVLGASIALRNEMFWCKIIASLEKVGRWIKDIEEYLRTDYFPPWVAMKLTGRLQWLLSLAASRVGRSFCKPLHAAINSPMHGYMLSPWCRRALLWFRAFPLQNKEMIAPLLRHCGVQHRVSWSDAGGKDRTVAALFYTAACKLEYTVWKCPQEVLDNYMHRDANYIGILGFIVFGAYFHDLSQRACRQVLDTLAYNAGTEGIALNGSATSINNSDVTNLCGRLWLHFAADYTDMFVGRVPTDSSRQTNQAGMCGASSRS